MCSYAPYVAGKCYYGQQSGTFIQNYSHFLNTKRFANVIKHSDNKVGTVIFDSYTFWAHLNGSQSI